MTQTELQKELYRMGLFGRMSVNSNTIFTRVPGGWVYEYFAIEGDMQGCCFIPFDNEFVE